MQTDLMKILGKQSVPFKHLGCISKICASNVCYDLLTTATMAFNYGVIIGVRKERQRKKKTLAQSANRTRENKGI